MRNLQKLGGLAALYEAVSYVAGMIFFLLVVDYLGVVDPLERVAMLIDNEVGFYTMTLVIYVVFGLALVVLALALHERLQASSPALMQVATAFGLIWATVLIASGMISNVGMAAVIALHADDPAQAATVWLAIDAVVNGIGGGVEIVGGLWSLLISWAALRSGGLPNALNYLGVAIGVAGIITVVPPLGEMGGIIFGLGQIVWFAWVGVVLLRNRPGATVPTTAETSNASIPRFNTTS